MKAIFGTYQHLLFPSSALPFRRFVHPSVRIHAHLAAMKEEFLHFVWENRSYDGQAWNTLDGAPIEVIDPGTHNFDQGPDFLNAHVRVEGMDYFGHVELHVDGRDWYRHQHHLDPLYNPVVLHVVWKHAPDTVLREDGTCIPEVSLENRVDPQLMKKADSWEKSKAKLPCQSLLAQVPAKVSRPWLTELGSARFRRKRTDMEGQLQDPEIDWNQVLWEAIARAIGGPVNGDAFQNLAQLLPYDIIVRYAHFPNSREALLFGVAGCLNGQALDAYHLELQDEWTYLRNLHGLKMSPVRFRFHRMRPATFPTLRLSQLGHLLSLFPRLIDLVHPDSFSTFLRVWVRTTPYWENHVVFGSATKRCRRALGQSFLRILFLNSLVPLGQAYALAHGDEVTAQKIEEYTYLLAPESNRITKRYSTAGLAPEHAHQSQAMVHLYKNFCKEKRCLSCGLGKWMLKAHSKAHQVA